MYNQAMENDRIRPLIYDTYISVVEKSPESTMFQTLISVVKGEKKDILNGGDLSCAFFVSFILCGFKLINAPHATVDGTIRDLEQSGWNEIKEMRKGCILVWQEKESHKHVGFYIGENEAISNDSKKRSIQKHHVTFGEEDGKPVRVITSMWWKEGLENM